MRPRDRDAPQGPGAEHGVAHGLVGIGEAPTEKGERMLHRFATLADGTLVWTRLSDGTYRLGAITGDLRRDDSAAARETGIVHVRDADWIEQAFTEADVPPAVAATFARGGRNLQRIHDADAEARSAALWQRRRS